MGIPVTQLDVIHAFEVTDGILPPTDARALLSSELAQLFNRHVDGGGGGGPILPGEHIQMSPSTAWVVVHNLGRPPVGVTVFDTTGRPVGCRIEHETLAWNQFTVRPGLAVGGRVTWL